MGEGEKLAQLKQSAKLAIALLEGQIHIVGFSDEARVSQPPLLTGGDARRGAMKYVDALKAGGDTNYPDALKALPGLPDGTPALLISDGQNTEGTDAQVLKLARLAPGPVHTIGIETTPEAQQLLDQIAAATHGAAVRLDSAEQLTKHMLKVAGSFGNYRAYTPQETDLVFPNTEGTVIAIGYDAVPDVQGTPPFPRAALPASRRVPGRARNRLPREACRTDENRGSHAHRAIAPRPAGLRVAQRPVAGQAHTGHIQRHGSGRRPACCDDGVL